MAEPQTVTLTDETGREHDFLVVDFLMVDDREYVVLLPAEEDGNEAVVLRVEVDEKGEETLYQIEDDEEWEAVNRAWEEAMEEEDDED